MSNNATETQGQEPGAGAAGQGQEPPANQGQGQESSTQQQTGGQQGQSGGFDVSTITDPAVRAYVEAQQRDAREAREQAARYRSERNTLTEAQEAAQRASETAEQTAQREQQEREQAEQQRNQRLEALEAENRSLRIGGAVTEAARTARAFDPAFVAEVLGPKITLDDQGAPTNVEAALTALQTEKPYLFRKASSRDAGAGQQDPNPEGGGGMNDLIRGAVRARRGVSTN